MSVLRPPGKSCDHPFAGAAGGGGGRRRKGRRRGGVGGGDGRGVGLGEEGEGEGAKPQQRRTSCTPPLGSCVRANFGPRTAPRGGKSLPLWGEGTRLASGGAKSGLGGRRARQQHQEGGEGARPSRSDPTDASAGGWPSQKTEDSGSDADGGVVDDGVTDEG